MYDNGLVFFQVDVTVQTRSHMECAHCGIPVKHILCNPCRNPDVNRVALHLDHAYGTKAIEASPPVKRKRKVTSTPCKNQDTNLLDAFTLDCSEHFSDLNDSFMDCSDRTYVPESESESEDDMDEVRGINHITDERKFIVFESSLDQLFAAARCLECNSAILNVNKTVVGTMLKVQTECINGHTSLNWTSQPIVGDRMPAGNLLCSAAVLFSGQNYSSAARYAELLNLQFIGQTAFYKIQRNYLVPVINDCWIKERESVIAELKTRDAVQLAGDGRCDSPGFCAKYCTYTFMDTLTGKVVDFELKQVTQTGTSQSMEKAGFQETLDRLLDCGVPVTDVSTDRHSGIKKIMRDKYKSEGIDHQFDPFHVANWIRKQLQAKSKYKKYSALAPWTKAIVSHLWWSARTCEEDPNMLEERWASVLHHITNEHEWEGNKLFHRCAHRYIIYVTHI